MRCSSSEFLLLIWCVMCSRSIWSSPRALGWTDGSGWGSFLSLGLFLKKSLPFMTHVSQPPSLDLKSLDLGLRFPNRGVLCDLWFFWYSRKCHCPDYLTVVIRSAFSSALVWDQLLNLLSSLDFSAPEHMHEKLLVTFRMAPKRSRRQRSEKEATIADGSRKSKCRLHWPLLPAPCRQEGAHRGHGEYFFLSRSE